MKIIELIKTKILPILLAASALATGLVATGCGDDSTDPEKERADALAAVNAFLADVKEGNNYTSVSVRTTMPTYTYYADGDKIKVEYDGKTEYGVIEKGNMYKIAQNEEDQSWHKNTDNDDLYAPSYRISTLIKIVNATLWNEYDGKTKALKCTYSDGSGTLKLEAGELTVTIIVEDRTNTFIINNVGATVVDLPENIIDDTQPTE